MSKYILSIVHRQSMSVVIVDPLVVTNVFFIDCGCLDVLIDVIAMHRCSHHQLKGSHFEFLCKSPRKCDGPNTELTPLVSSLFWTFLNPLVILCKFLIH